MIESARFVSRYYPLQSRQHRMVRHGVANGRAVQEVQLLVPQIEVTLIHIGNTCSSGPALIRQFHAAQEAVVVIKSHVALGHVSGIASHFLQLSRGHLSWAVHCEHRSPPFRWSGSAAPGSRIVSSDVGICVATIIGMIHHRREVI